MLATTPWWRPIHIAIAAGFGMGRGSAPMHVDRARRKCARSSPYSAYRERFGIRKRIISVEPRTVHRVSRAPCGGRGALGCLT